MIAAPKSLGLCSIAAAAIPPLALPPLATRSEGDVYRFATSHSPAAT